MTETIFDKHLLNVNFDYFFSLAPSANMGGGGAYDLCCSQTPGGDQNVLASL